MRLLRLFDTFELSEAGNLAAGVSLGDEVFTINSMNLGFVLLGFSVVLCLYRVYTLDFLGCAVTGGELNGYPCVGAGSSVCFTSVGNCSVY
ncbi:MAG: hypothetical protein H6677_06185 [Candidatus Obscuribacterales bacterium]|nr:hypothetical protein [Candidatus Obscuribacterales bacterium]